MAVTVNSKSWDESGLAWTKNPVFLQIQADANWQDADVYTIEVQVFRANITIAVQYYTPIVNETDPSLPDFTGQVTVDVSALIDASLEENFSEIIDPEASEPYFIEQPARFGVSVNDITDGVPGSPVANYLYAFQGGMAFEDFSPENQYGWVYKQRKFLSNAPDPKPTFPESKEFIYYCPPFVSGWFDSLLVKGKVFYSDGTEADFSPYGTTPTATNTAFIWCVPVGYEALGLDALELSGKDIVEYTVWIYSETSTQIISEYFRFSLSANPRETAQIMFKNSFGVFETLSGSIRRKEFQANTEFGQRSLLTNYQAKDGQQFTRSVNGQRRFRFTSAFLNNSEAELYQEIGRSDQVLLYSQQKLIAIGTPQFSIEYFDREKELFGLVIEFTQLNTIRSITRNVARREKPVVSSQPFIQLTGNFVAGSVILNWTTSVNEGVKFYSLFRSTVPDVQANGVFLGIRTKDVRSYFDFTAVTGNTYYYALREYYINDSFEWSNEVEINVVDDVEEAERPNGSRLLSDGGIRLLSDGVIRTLTTA